MHEHAARGRAGRPPDAGTTSTRWPATSRCTRRWSTGSSSSPAPASGLSNFRTEKPWRPPSLLLEADPPRHDAPRRVLHQGARPAGAAPAARRSGSPTPRRWSTRCSPTARSSTSSRGWPRRSRCGCSRTRSASPPEGRENLLPYGDHAFNAFGPANDLVAKGAPRVAELSGLGGRAVRPGRARAGGVRRGDLGRRGPRRHHPGAGAAGRPLAAHRRGRHHRARHLRRPLRLRHPPRPVAAAARRTRRLARVAFDEAVRWESPVQTFFRTATTDVRVGGTVVPEGRKILMFLASANRDPRRWADPDRVRPRPRPVGARRLRHGHPPVRRPARRPAGGGRACVTALARRVRSIELAGPHAAAPQQHPAGLAEHPGPDHRRLTGGRAHRPRLSAGGGVQGLVAGVVAPARPR